MSTELRSTYEQLASGIHVPGHVAEEARAEARVRRTWAWAQFKLLRRLVQFFVDEDLMFAMVCKKCNTPALAKQHENGNDHVVRCACTDRIIHRS